MKIIEAVESNGAVRVVVHLDETMEVPDPALPVPAEGEPDTRRIVPDPAYVMELEWGADVPEEVVKRETALLAAAELDRRRSAGRNIAGLDGATLEPPRGGK